jgi:hypothetical protein
MSAEITLGMSYEERTAILLANGFDRTTYSDKEGDLIVKHVIIDNMPYAKEHMIDNEYICSGMTAILEICPDGQVQLHIPDAEYLENYPVDTEEGVALINDVLPARRLEPQPQRSREGT